MQPLPHTYHVSVEADVAGDVTVAAPGLPSFPSASPPEFDGPGGRWSPESLLCSAAASCFILTFRAVARASKFDWRHLSCQVEGTLERKDGATQFTRMVTHAVLKVDGATDLATAQRLLEKAERGCLIANSLKAERVLTTDIQTQYSANGD
ncbi:MAG: OsmC family protein [Steroidobacteraceae bacterium]